MSGKAIRETLGFLAVIASLVFVGMEIRGNTITARAAAYQELGIISVENWKELQHDPAFAQLIVAANDSTQWDQIDEAGWFQLRAGVMVGMRGWETLRLQVQTGLLPPEALERFGYGRNYWPYLHRMWPEVRANLSEGFATYVEQQFGIAP